MTAVTQQFISVRREQTQVEGHQLIQQQQQNKENEAKYQHNESECV